MGNRIGEVSILQIVSQDYQCQMTNPMFLLNNESSTVQPLHVTGGVGRRDNREFNHAILLLELPIECIVKNFQGRRNQFLVH
jgi:hypothetical protein